MPHNTPEELLNTTETRASREDRILAAAEKEFAWRGFSGTRVADIAEEAAVNTALVHYYYGSKEQLYHAVLDHLFQEWQVHVRASRWDDDDPMVVLRRYIRTHFEYQRRNPSLYRIFQWETLEGGNIFQRYVASFWKEDVLEKTRVLQAWKERGQLNPNVTPRTLLYLIWGMMNQFYYRSGNELSGMVDIPADDPYELQEACLLQISELALHGVLPKRFARVSARSPDNEMPRSVSILLCDERAEHDTDTAELCAGLNTLPTIEAHIRPISDADDIPRDDHGSLLVLSSDYGELSPVALRVLERMPKPATDAEPTGVWVIGSHDAAASVQTSIETRFDRLGYYTVRRLTGQEPREYGYRLAKLISRTQ